jgi:hypothetical protein
MSSLGCGGFRCQRRLDQRHFSAEVTSPARKGLRSMKVVIFLDRKGTKAALPDMTSPGTVSEAERGQADCKSCGRL